MSESNELNQAVETIEKKRGFVLMSDPTHRCGVIISGFERFWFHFNSIIYGPEVPAVRDAVMFEVSPAPKMPRKLQVAIQVIIVETKAGTDALARPVENDGQKADAKVGD